VSRRHTPPAAAPNAVLRLSAKVRIQGIREYIGKPRIGKNGRPGKPYTSYTVRWVVEGEEHHSTFATWALADAWRSKLITFQREGVLFDISTGLPEPLAREAISCSWYQLCVAFVDLKWAGFAPKSRASAAESLSRATTALTTTNRGAPDPKVLRQALEHYAFNKTARTAGPPPEHLADAIDWISKNTVPMASFAERTQGAALVRAALNSCATRLDNGQATGANTIARRRAVVYGCLDYGVERGYMTTNPMSFVKWTAPEVVTEVDSRTVVNSTQGRRFLNEVRRCEPTGPRLVAFFGLQYWAGLRPSEALHVRRSCFLKLPEKGWGDGLLEESNPRGGRRWTDTGTSRQPRQLKHRAVGATRPFPVHPALVKILLWHFEEFDTGPDDLLFLGPRGGLLAEWVYLDVFHRARAAALTPAEAASPLLNVPYSLRHACVSTQLNAGVPATQVAEWAGHGVDVLLKVYAKCIVGEDETAKRRIEAATQAEDEEPPPPAITQSDEESEGGPG
jgi:integrase